MKSIIAITLIAASAFAFADTIAPFQVGQKLMVDENGDLYPKGAVLGVKDAAAIAASNAVTEASIEVVKEVQKATEREVGLVVETLTGVNAYAYCEDFVESLGGVSQASTNATCHIAKFNIGAKKETIDGVSYSAQELYYYFTEPMNGTPYITFSTELEQGSTNEWTKAELQNVEYLGKAIIDGIEFENCYKSTVWTLSELDKCFYRVQCKINAAVGDGSMFEIFGGIKVNGEAGDTITTVVQGIDGKLYDHVYEGGLLKKIKPHEEIAE